MADVKASRDGTVRVDPRETVRRIEDAISMHAAVASRVDCTDSPPARLGLQDVSPEPLLFRGSDLGRQWMGVPPRRLIARGAQIASQGWSIWVVATRRHGGSGGSLAPKRTA
jgi:hypothetical protein